MTTDVGIGVTAVENQQVSAYGVENLQDFNGMRAASGALYTILCSTAKRVGLLQRRVSVSRVECVRTLRTQEIFRRCV